LQQQQSGPSEVIGVAALARPDLVIEIVAVAALPD
jgi:enamine deaminase RidA (YjgF/YER057c/UK114 family)